MKRTDYILHIIILLFVDYRNTNDPFRPTKYSPRVFIIKSPLTTNTVYEKIVNTCKWPTIRFHFYSVLALRYEKIGLLVIGIVMYPTTLVDWIPWSHIFVCLS